MAESKKIIFFAYQGRYNGRADDNVDAIKYAISEYNKYQKTFLAKSWEEYKKTVFINQEILSIIDSCAVFVCDITYFNHNVLFELGYAIARDKPILILLNENIKGAKEKYRDSIFKVIRYTSITNHKSVLAALQQKNENLLSIFVNPGKLKTKSSDLFYIQSTLSNQASLELTTTINDYIKGKICTLVTDDSNEIEYKPLEWYFQNIVKSKAVIIHFLGKDKTLESEENAKNSFYAGIACGLDCKVLLVAPAAFRAPLDYADILIQYSDTFNLTTNVKTWLQNQLPLLESPEKITKELHEYNLISLGVGCDVAEQERSGLLNYFVPTSSYYAALKYEKSLIVGRKGSGKSAIYIKLSNEIPKDSLNYVINLKPESDELLADVEMSKLCSTPSAKKSFFFTVWKIVIYSKLIEIIYDRLIEKPGDVGYSAEEQAIIDFTDVYSSLINMGFFGIVKEISKKVKNTVQVNNADIIESLYSEYYHPLVKTLKNYYTSINSRYLKIIILADSLDKTWDSQHDLDSQTEMILTLLEMGDKIHSELTDKRGLDVEVKNVIFLRQDIFEYILNKTIEPDKLTTMSHEVNWENYPRSLKQLIEDRFKHILSLKNDAEVESKAWAEFFDLKNKGNKHPYQVIEEIIIRRPRDLIYFISRLFESAINKDHSKVSAEDLGYAIEKYTTFLNNNLIAETKAIFPEIPQILIKLHEYRGQKLEYKNFYKIIAAFKYNPQKIEQLVETLFGKNYMIGYDDKTNQSFSDLSILKSKLSQKRFLFFSNKVYIIAHAQYYYIKNKSL